MIALTSLIQPFGDWLIKLIDWLRRWAPPRDPLRAGTWLGQAAAAGRLRLRRGSHLPTRVQRARGVRPMGGAHKGQRAGVVPLRVSDACTGRRASVSARLAETPACTRTEERGRPGECRFARQAALRVEFAWAEAPARAPDGMFPRSLQL
jgi:hypothetical protein